MNCQEFARLAVLGNPLEPKALRHLEMCAPCSRLEEGLAGRFDGPAMPPARLDALRKSIVADLAPVRAIPSPLRLAAWFACSAALVMVLGTAALKTRGLAAISSVQAFAVFSIVAVALLLAAGLLAQLMAPGSLLRLWPRGLAVVTIIALAAAIVALFPVFAIPGFLGKGLVCLAIGTGFAVAGILLANIVLKWGAVLDRTAAGVAAGLFAGTAAVAVQEIYCQYAELRHVVGFHVTTIAIAILLGLLWGRRISS